MDLHVKQVTYKTVENGYMLGYAQQTNQVATQGEFVFNTLGQLEAKLRDLDEEHDRKVKAIRKAEAEHAAAQVAQTVEGKQ